MNILTHIIALTFMFVLVQSVDVDEDLPFIHPSCDEYEDAGNPTHLPYPNDCTKFLKCSGGYAYPMKCPLRLHWSVANNRCDFPSVAACNFKAKMPTRATTSVVHRNDDGFIISSTCPVTEDPNNQTLLPYPGNCNLFYKCDSGIAYAMPCPRRMHFSVALKRCAWQSVANCSFNE